MAISSEQLAQITSRAGVLRAGTGRAGVAAEKFEMKPNSGEIIWNRPPAADGDPGPLPFTQWSTDKH